jgi:transposase
MGDQRRRYDEEFKRKTVELIEKTGKTKAAVARELDIPANCITGWVKKYGTANAEASKQAQLLADYERLKKLEQQNRELLEEREILLKANRFFSKKRD